MKKQRWTAEVRRHIAQLRLAGYSSDEIGSKLHITREQVDAEMAAADDVAARKIGRNFRASDEVIRSLQVYDAVEQSAVRLLLELEADPAALPADKLKAAAAVRDARNARVEALVAVRLLTVDGFEVTDSGLIDATEAQRRPPVTWEQARRWIAAQKKKPGGREALKKRGHVEPSELVSRGERRWLGSPHQRRRINDDQRKNRSQQAERVGVDGTADPGGQGRGVPQRNTRRAPRKARESA